MRLPGIILAAVIGLCSPLAVLHVAALVLLSKHACGCCRRKRRGACFCEGRRDGGGCCGERGCFGRRSCAMWLGLCVGAGTAVLCTYILASVKSMYIDGDEGMTWPVVCVPFIALSAAELALCYMLHQQKQACGDGGGGATVHEVDGGAGGGGATGHQVVAVQ